MSTTRYILAAVTAASIVGAHAQEARADEPSYAILLFGGFAARTSIHHLPAAGDGFTTTAAPTLGFRYWGERRFPIVVGFQFDALTAVAIHLSEARFFPAFGGDVGITFGLAGGKVALGAAIEQFQIKKPDYVFGEPVTDLAGQLRYTHPIAGLVRLDLALQAGASGTAGHEQGSQGSAFTQVIVKVNPHLSIYGSFNYDVRTYEDSAAEQGELVFTTAMVRVGIGVHNLGKYLHNNF